MSLDLDQGRAFLKGHVDTRAPTQNLPSEGHVHGSG